MSEIYEKVGMAIKELRTSFGGKGVSQAELGRALKIPANTISRWETGVYKPSIEDLDMLANFFGVPIALMFPEGQPSPKMKMLWSAMEGLEEADIDELISYALFKRAMTASRTRKIA
jgi:transcriptional regulator with XRE-family HTH domain